MWDRDSIADPITSMAYNEIMCRSTAGLEVNFFMGTCPVRNIVTFWLLRRMFMFGFAQHN